jgi:hypothetical protein
MLISTVFGILLCLEGYRLRLDQTVLNSGGPDLIKSERAKERALNVIMLHPPGCVRNAVHSSK